VEREDEEFIKKEKLTKSKLETFSEQVIQPGNAAKHAHNQRNISGRRGPTYVI
jgi:hypothetical protein